MALSVALPSFDAFLRSARRTPAVLPRAAPVAYSALTIRTAVNAYEPTYGYDSPAARSAPARSMTPPGSPYYGHFVSLSPVSAPAAASDESLDVDTWRLTASSGSDMEEDESACYHHPAATRYQELLTQQCVAIAPRPRDCAPPPTKGAASSAEADAKPARTKKKYLKERQRCEIVRRVRAGEKQAHLAKEFGVSRAAVCYLLKHEFDILRRSALRQQRRKLLH